MLILLYVVLYMFLDVYQFFVDFYGVVYLLKIYNLYNYYKIFLNNVFDLKGVLKGQG